MRLTTLAVGATAYFLGTRAGQERHDQLVRAARRFAGSQTVQSTAGVVQAQLDRSVAHARQAFTQRLAGR